MKVKSTAQQEEEKRKDREKKLKIYVAARDACFTKVFQKASFISCSIQYVLHDKAIHFSFINVLYK